LTTVPSSFAAACLGRNPISPPPPPPPTAHHHRSPRATHFANASCGRPIASIKRGWAVLKLVHCSGVASTELVILAANMPHQIATSSRRSPAALVAVNLLLFVSQSQGLPCPNLCSGHGHCDDTDRVCRCFDGWMGGDCSLMKCPTAPAWTDLASGVDNAHQEKECSNRGMCDRSTGMCFCEEERFEGTACERKSCPNNCNSRGRCLSMGYYSTLKDPGSGTIFQYDHVWDQGMMYGCVCDTGFFGPDCSLRHCPRGDDPLTGTDSDPAGTQVNEQQIIVCRASGGTFTLTFRGATTDPIPYRATLSEFQEIFDRLPTISSQYGESATVVTFEEEQACTISGTRMMIDFLQDFGDLPLLVPDKTNLQMSITTATTLLTVGEARAGTKEDSHCSDRGICIYLTGVCQCSQGYDTSNGNGGAGVRGDCGKVDAAITACPGETQCSGHGVCAGVPTYRCDCANGFMGADCSLMTCPTGKSWYSLPTENNEAHLSFSECSDMGTCDRTTGTCSCMAGFEGAACNLMSCPGQPACNGNGQCLSMSALAKEATINGDDAEFTYGATPNDPLTWDHDMMQGCFCDEGFTGFDCSLRTCPFGDDPYTVNRQYNEVQKIACDTNGDDTGTFTFTFRKEVTELISVLATANQVRAALEALHSVGRVSVYTDLGVGKETNVPICSDSEMDFYVEFMYPTGDVPMITIDANGPSMEIKERVKGSKEFIECSGRGLCDRATGICSCFPGFSASDGQAGDGNIANCGYVEPIVRGMSSEG